MWCLITPCRAYKCASTKIELKTLYYIALSGIIASVGTVYYIYYKNIIKKKDYYLLNDNI